MALLHADVRPTTHDAAVVVSSRCMTFCSCLMLLLYRKGYRMWDCMQIAEAATAEEGAGSAQCRRAHQKIEWAALPVREEVIQPGTVPVWGCVS